MSNIYRINQTSVFKKDLKRIIKQGKDINELETIVDDLAAGRQLLPKYRDHALTGNRKDFRDCHIDPDWILLYKIDNQYMVLVLARTGSHSELEI